MEALLSALECCGVDNARIEMEGGEEVPVADGSAIGWAINIVVAGLQPAHAVGDAKGRTEKRRALKPTQVWPAFSLHLSPLELLVLQVAYWVQSCEFFQCLWDS